MMFDVLEPRMLLHVLCRLHSPTASGRHLVGPDLHCCGPAFWQQLRRQVLADPRAEHYCFVETDVGGGHLPRSMFAKLGWKMGRYDMVCFATGLMRVHVCEAVSVFRIGSISSFPDVFR